MGTSYISCSAGNSVGTYCTSKSIIAPCKESTICYAELSTSDEEADLNCPNEKVWCALEPPKFTNLMNKPLVSARQIDIVRAKVCGKLGQRPIGQAKPLATNAKRKEVLEGISKCRLPPPSNQ